MKRYRVVQRSWKSWPFFVQERRLWSWMDVDSFPNEQEATSRARALAFGDIVKFDSAQPETEGGK